MARAAQRPGNVRRKRRCTASRSTHSFPRFCLHRYDRIFNMKFLPPGRGLWAMGSPITEDRQLYAALNNCAFVSTSNLRDGPARPFCFLMDAAMLGVGVGFDTAGAVRRLWL